LTGAVQRTDNVCVPEGSAWDEWERLRTDPDPDPIEVLKAISGFQRYFAAIEKEAIRVARSQERTWQEIGAALGRTRQALWQRVASRNDEGEEPRWPEILEAAWVQTASVRYRVGLPPT
jgi:hypothetical protein